MDLGINHPLYDKLPYYWYYYGPYCELITESFNDFTPSSKNLFSLNNVKLGTEYEIIDEFPELIDLGENLLDKGNYIYKDLTEDIYKNHAPFDIIYPFKYGIFNQTENDNLMISGDDYVKLFRQCQLKLIQLYDIREFSTIFTTLTRQIDLINDSDKINECWSLLKSPIRNSWFTFAKGLRLYAHDSYYDACFEKWGLTFKYSLEKLEKEIIDLIDNTFDSINHYDNYKYTDSQKRILDSTVGAYLRDD